jgi:D-alanyl-D-alanine carboxypeptidase/D-alanyl-D-alanine-endopeptidase (penicillin-binding protein 4)
MCHRLLRYVLGVLLLITAAIWVSPTGTAAARPVSERSHLQSRLHDVLKGSGAGHLDFRINDPAYGNFSRAAHRASAPASNEKLFTTITLLSEVGPNFHYVTKVFGTAALVGHSLDGDLVVRGSGDPTLTRAGLLKLARRLHRAGLHHVSGNLIIDDTRYSHKTRVSGWKHKFVPEETGPMSAFTVDHNEWRGGASFDRDPTRDNARLFRTALHKAHITIRRRIEVRRTPPDATLLLTHRSAHLSAIVDATLTDSINFDAEMMLREAGAQRSGHGSPATGVAAIQAMASKLGVPLGTAHDGSGLSYTDRETPATLVRWLTTLKSLPIYKTVYYALPLSCETGTLKYRMCGPNVRGEVRAKTGTLTHVSALSGYVISKVGHPITFSFLASGVKNFTKLYSKVDAAVALFRKSG